MAENGSTTKHTSAVQNRGGDALDDDAAYAGALPPSYILSEQRRSELLQAARANRTSWVDGVLGNGGNNGQGSNGVLPTSSLYGAAVVPPHCQHAIEQIGVEMQAFFASLDELKRRIIPNDLCSDETSLPSRPNDDNQVSDAYVPMVDELRALQAELESWRQVHLRDGRLLQTKRMTAADKEMRFLLAFQELLVLLKHPLAAELVYQIQMFVKKFEHWNLETMLRRRTASDRPGGHVQAFIDKIVRQLRHQEVEKGLFAASGVEILRVEDDEDELLHEVLEAFLMEKLYAKALTPSIKAEHEDQVLHDRLESLSFVAFRHLDLPIPTTDDVLQQWEQLTEQLRCLPSYLSPRRKMDCVLRVCQELTNLLSSLHARGKFPSADEFLPGLIYLLLKANPRELKRNVHFILEYRRPTRLVSEPGYFFTHLVSSVAFLEQVNGELLTITPEEFEDGLRRSKTQAAQEIAHAVADQSSLENTSAASDGNDNQKDDEYAFNATRELKLPTVLEVRARRLAEANYDL